MAWSDNVFVMHESITEIQIKNPRQSSKKQEYTIQWHQWVLAVVWS